MDVPHTVEELPSESEQSPSIGALAAALAKAQGAMRHADKDSTNPHFRSRYADLASVVDACREALAANGLAYVQRVGTSQDGASVRITTMLLHSSGEWLKDSLWVPVSKRDAQGIGSAITYGRRYGLMAMVGVAPSEDDDGNGAVGHVQPDAGQRSAQPNASPRQSRTEAAKDKVRQGLGAAKREEEAAVDESIQAMLAISLLQKEFSVPPEKIASIIKGATNKGDRSQLRLEDVEKVRGALEYSLQKASSPFQPT
jgi:hypothetical protein